MGYTTNVLTIREAIERVSGNGAEKAKVLGITPQFVSMLLAGKSGISVGLAARIAKAAGLGMHYDGYGKFCFREPLGGDDDNGK